MGPPRCSSRWTASTHRLPPDHGPARGADRPGGGLYAGTQTPVPRARDHPCPDLRPRWSRSTSPAIRPCIAGPRNPEDRLDLDHGARPPSMGHHQEIAGRPVRPGHLVPVAVEDAAFALHDGAVVIAAITSCTNTANAANMMAAGLLARKAVAKWAADQAVGEDVARSRQPGHGGRAGAGRAAGRAGHAGIPHRGVRLHHLQRRLRAAAGRASWTRSSARSS